MSTGLGGAYAYFCDDNDLKRIGASAEVHLANLDKMAAALLAERARHLKVIAERCPHCGQGKPA